MKRPATVQFVDGQVLIVWVFTLAVGVGIWLGSDTPFVGAGIIVAIILAVASPAGALYAMCAAIPLIFHPVRLGSSSMSLLELSILTTALGTGLRVLLNLYSRNRTDLRSFFAPVRIWLLPLLLFVVGTLSLFWMPFDLHRAEALRTWRWVIFEPLVVFGLARYAVARNGRAALVVAMCLPGGFLGLLAVWQLIDSSSTFTVDAVHRSTATYLHPNNLALYLERVFFLAFVPALLMKNRWRWFFFLLAGLNLAGLSTTFSRGVFLAFLAGGATILFLRPQRRGWSILGFTLAGAGIIFGLLAGKRLVGSGSSGFLATRMGLWRDSSEMLRDFPWTGIGLDQFLWLHQQRYIDPSLWRERYTSHPHNLIFDSWLSLGLAGLFTLGLFLAIGMWFLRSVRSNRRTLDIWQIAALVTLAAGLGHALVDNGYFLPDLAVITWLCIALIVTTVPHEIQPISETGDG